MRRFTPLFFGLIMILPLMSQTVEVQYVDGLLEAQRGSNWQELFIGDRLSSSAVLKLDEGGYAELSAGTQTIKLSEPGQYALSDLLEVSQKLSGWTGGSALGNRLSALGGRRASVEEKSAQMGVRGDAKGQTEMAWMEDEGAELKKESLTLIEAGDYAKARGLLQEAIDLSLDDQEEAEYRFYAAYTEQMLGKPSEALRLLDGIQPDPMADYFGDYTLLHGRLLVESLSFGRALTVLDDYLAKHSQGSAGQVALIYAAAAHVGLGEPGEARRRLKKAQSLDPKTAAGEKASELLARL